MKIFMKNFLLLKYEETVLPHIYTQETHPDQSTAITENDISGILNMRLERILDNRSLERESRDGGLCD
jgi:hypothetical protein